MLAVKRVMTKQVVKVFDTDTLETVVDLILRHGDSGLPVLNSEHELVGLITEHDLLRVLYDIHSPRNCVRDYMTTDLVTIDENTSLMDATDLMLAHRIHRVLVVRGRKLAGVLAQRDVIRYIRDVRLLAGLSLLGDGLKGSAAQPAAMVN